MLTDIEIARRTHPQRIVSLAEERLGIAPDHLRPYGHDKAKISLDYLQSLPERDGARLILVTAISPTPAGEGKTTTTVGLGDGLNRIGRQAIVCIREPSLGPVFGMKGGAAGGGHAQVIPMEDINLHFTGDFHAIALANNLLAALIDNHIHQGNALGIDVRRVSWKRVVDMNDRALRQIVVGLGGTANGHPREDGFDIVVASEIMAVLCLADSLADLKTRLGRIVVGYTTDDRPVTARDLKADGAMAVLLRDAIHPNLVQTLEHTPALVHGGPFANIAHGCNSLIATRAGLKLADYTVTEAGFGADLGAEKFIDIKCRAGGLTPDVVVVVATLRALKYHGGVALDAVSRPDLQALTRGLSNLERHAGNIHDHFGLGCVVALNHFSTDTDDEIALVTRHMGERGVRVVVARHWAEGGRGAEDLARAVVDAIAPVRRPVTFLYPADSPLLDKARAIATKIYGARDVAVSPKVRARIERLERDGYGSLPVCMAKTQMSFSTDATALGAPSDHVVDIREVRLMAGAGFVVFVCGDLMTMPGLPRVPAAERIDIGPDGRITGLF